MTREQFIEEIEKRNCVFFEETREIYNRKGGVIGNLQEVTVYIECDGVGVSHFPIKVMTTDILDCLIDIPTAVAGKDKP